MSEPEKPFLPRWARYLLLPGLFLPVLVVVFVNAVQFVHDETRCPYVRGETRSLGEALSVREDRRNCLWDLEDRRFSVIRAGQEHMLGSRRFRADAFAQGHYEWSAELSTQDEVQLRVKNAGHKDATFREGTPQERARDQ
ncbi:MAG: hypothetical protein RL701_1129 [Pseudomonadota bacterium]